MTDNTEKYKDYIQHTIVGEVASLNVSVAAAVIMYEALEQRQPTL